MSAAEANGKDFADLADARQAVEAALAAGDTPKAIALAGSAIGRGFRDAMFHNLLAYDLEQQGRYAEAMAELQRAYELAPRDVVILNAIGRCLLPQGRLPEALKVYDAALSIEPAYVPTLVNKADALALDKQYDEARSVFQQALAIHPGSADALAGLASIELRRGALDDARELAERALAQAPNQDVAALTLAEVVADAAGARAEDLLRAVLSRGPSGEVRAQAESQLGDVLDGTGRYAEAFAAYAAAGKTLSALHASQYAIPGAPTVLEMVQWHTMRFDKAAPADWVGPTRPPQPSDPRRLIFFVGFPRSGTTLLEQILASHPDVLALDERHALAEATRDLFVSDPKLERLRTISAEEAQVYREGYWRNVAAYCPDVAGKVFVDKYPLNSERLPLIAKLFPEARILFALRDPRDVVLSCFRRRFEMNPRDVRVLHARRCGCALRRGHAAGRALQSQCSPFRSTTCAMSGWSRTCVEKLARSATSSAWSGTMRCWTSPRRRGGAAFAPPAPDRSCAASTTRGSGTGATTEPSLASVMPLLARLGRGVRISGRLMSTAAPSPGETADSLKAAAAEAARAATSETLAPTWKARWGWRPARPICG